MRLWRLVLRLLGALFGGVWYARKIGVAVGNDCRIYTSHFGTEPFLINIGDRVTVTSGVKFITHDGSTWLVRDESGRRFRFGKIIVGSDVFIGVNAIILPDVEVGSRVVIGAGSVVTRTVPSGVVVAGVPARVVGSYDAFFEKVKNTCPSEADCSRRRAGSYEEWVMSCIDWSDRRSTHG